MAPPLPALGGPVLQFAVREGFDFLPLKGERDRQYEFGLSIPIGRWGIDLAHFDTDCTKTSPRSPFLQISEQCAYSSPIRTFNMRTFDKDRARAARP
jgi:hypothetical protein